MQITKLQNKVILFLVLIIILLLGLIEVNNIMVDKYNFKQLEKAKLILDKIPRDAKKFYNLKEFNEQYNAGIIPIKNCYYVRNINGDYPYIFGFKLESLFYKIKFSQNFYAYPKYDLPPKQVCFGLGLNGSCEKDNNRRQYEYIISNLCKN